MVFGGFVAAVDFVMAENETACPSCGQRRSLQHGHQHIAQGTDNGGQIGSAVSRSIQ